MELTELKNRIIAAFTGSQSNLAIVNADPAIFPFNEYEHLICSLIDKDGMGHD